MRDYDELVSDLRKMLSTDYCAIASATDFPAIRIVQDAADAIEELVAESADLNGQVKRSQEEIRKLDKLLAAVSKWISVDRNNLPGHEVIAVNAKPGSYGYKEMLVGMVIYSEEKGFFACESDEGAILINVTHYMEKPMLPEPPKEVRDA